MDNPFAQVPFYYQLSFLLPFAGAQKIEDAFDSIALSASAFEIDEEREIWKCDLLFTQPPDMEEIIRRVALLALLSGVPMPEIEHTKIEQADWLAMVARDFPPLSVGRFFIHGAHAKDEVPRGLIPIQVEAGAAFGSGEHGTTRGCIEALEWIAKRTKRRRILDMGTGSGILAIAAAKLWNADILAVDIDPIAAAVAHENARINHEFAIRCGVSDGYKSAIVKRFGTCDLIIANILARPLIAFAPHLARQLQPGGYAVLSGLLDDQENMVFSTHRAQGLSLVGRIHHEGWCTLLLKK